MCLGPELALLFGSGAAAGTGAAIAGTAGAGVVSASTIGTIGLGLQVAGALTGASAAYQASAMNKVAYEHQAAVERNKATVVEMQAKDAIARGQRAQFKAQLERAQMTGAQRARFAAAGLDLNEGSPLNVLLDTEFFGKMDEMTLADNAEMEAWSLRESARTGRSNADFLRMRADAESPGRAAFGSLLGGAGTVASSWYRLKQKTG